MRGEDSEAVLVRRSFFSASLLLLKNQLTNGEALPNLLENQ